MSTDEIEKYRPSGEIATPALTTDILTTRIVLGEAGPDELQFALDIIRSEPEHVAIRALRRIAGLPEPEITQKDRYRAHLALRYYAESYGVKDLGDYSVVPQIIAMADIMCGSDFLLRLDTPEDKERDAYIEQFLNLYVKATHEGTLEADIYGYGGMPAHVVKLRKVFEQFKAGNVRSGTGLSPWQAMQREVEYQRVVSARTEVIQSRVNNLPEGNKAYAKMVLHEGTERPEPVVIGKGHVSHDNALAYFAAASNLVTALGKQAPEWAQQAAAYRGVADMLSEYVTNGLRMIAEPMRPPMAMAVVVIDQLRGDRQANGVASVFHTTDEIQFAGHMMLAGKALQQGIRGRFGREFAAEPGTPEFAVMAEYYLRTLVLKDREFDEPTKQQLVAFCHERIASLFTRGVVTADPSDLHLPPETSAHLQKLHADITSA